MKVSMNTGYLYILLTTLFFSSMETALKGVVNDFHPMQITLTRFLVGALALTPFALMALRKRGVWPTGRELVWCALLGFLGIFVSMGVFQLALEVAPASVVAVLFSCNPVFVLLFARFILGSPIRGDQYLALACQLAGIVCIIDPLGNNLNLFGCGLTIASAAFFGLYAVCGVRTSLRLSGMAVTWLSFIFGSLELLLVALSGHIPAVAECYGALGLDILARIPFFSGYSAANWPTMLYVYVCVTGLGYAFYFMSMELTSPATTSLIFFFKPVLAPLLAWAWLGEEIPLPMKVGIVLILAGSALPLWRRRLDVAKIRKEKACTPDRA